jgi:uncharacterized protein (DUF433 family)
MVMAANPIKIDAEIMHGVPCFAGTRVPVRSLFDLLAHNRTLEYFLEQFPTVSREQALAVLRMAAQGIWPTAA